MSPTADLSLTSPTVDDLCRPPLDEPRGSRKYWVRKIKSRCLSQAATALGLVCGMRPGPAFGILMYHRISPHIAGLPAPTWNVTPERFESQIAGLLRRGFEPWPLRKALEHSCRGLSISRNAFVVTFDDGYENVYRNAFPILQRYQVPATIFLATAYLDSDKPFPCDDWSAKDSAQAPALSWQPLSTDACRQMQASGLIELGAHTHTHQDFRNRPEALRVDLQHNVDCLRDRFGLRDATFAFPYGVVEKGFAGPPLNEVARKVGLLCSLSTESKLVRAGSDPFVWGRFNAEAYDTAASLAAKLQGWYETLRSAKRRVTAQPIAAEATR